MLMLVTGQELVRDRGEGKRSALVQTVLEAVQGGVTMVQLREKDLSTTDLTDLATEIRDSLPPPVLLVVNGNVTAVLQSGASGLHLPEAASLPSLAGINRGSLHFSTPTHPYTHPDWIKIRRMIKIIPTHPSSPALSHTPALPHTHTLLLGRSIHSVEGARRAEGEGMDYLVAGAIFETFSHPGASPRGLHFLEEVCRAVSIPVLAIGGILPQNVHLCVEAGAAGVAVRSPILGAPSPAAAAARYHSALAALG